MQSTNCYSEPELLGQIGLVRSLLWQFRFNFQEPNSKIFAWVSKSVYMFPLTLTANCAVLMLRRQTLEPDSRARKRLHFILFSPSPLNLYNSNVSPVKNWFGSLTAAGHQKQLIQTASSSEKFVHEWRPTYDFHRQCRWSNTVFAPRPKKFSDSPLTLLLRQQCDQLNGLGLEFQHILRYSEYH